MPTTPGPPRRSRSRPTSMPVPAGPGGYVSDISDRGLERGFGLVIDGDAPAYGDLIHGGSALADLPAGSVQSVQIEPAQDAYRYGNYASGAHRLHPERRRPRGRRRVGELGPGRVAGRLCAHRRLRAGRSHFAGRRHRQPACGRGLRRRLLGWLAAPRREHVRRARVRRRRRSLQFQRRRLRVVRDGLAPLPHVHRRERERDGLRRPGDARAAGRRLEPTHRPVSGSNIRAERHDGGGPRRPTSTPARIRSRTPTR